MSHHSEQDIQQTLTPTEARQQLLTRIEADKQALQELSDEELVEVAGGGLLGAFKHGSTVATINGGDKIAQIKTGLYSMFKGGHTENTQNNQKIWNYGQKQATRNQPPA